MPLPLIITMIWLQLAGAHAARQLRNIQRVENLAQLEGCAKPSGSHGSDFAPSRHFFTRQFSLEMLLLMFPLKRIYGKTLACFQMRNLTVVLQTLFRSSKLCMSHPSSLASLSHSYFESLGRNIEEQADCQTRIEICWFWRGHKSEIKTETTWGFNPDGVAAVLQPPRNHTVSQT